MIFAPLDFIARLAAPVPKPRVNRTRLHGVLAPHRKHRARGMPAKRGQGHQANASNELAAPTPAAQRASLTGAQRRKRVVNLDIETGRQCGASVRRIAAMEDPVVIKTLRTHL